MKKIYLKTARIFNSSRLAILIVAATFISVGAFASSLFQWKNITISMKNTSLVQVLNEIEKEADCKMNYFFSLVDKYKGITIEMQNASVKDILNKALAGTDLTFSIDDGVVTISQKEAKKTVQQEKREISGVVIEKSTKKPIPGATMIIVGTSEGAIADHKGNFVIKAKDGQTIEASFVGMKTQLITVTPTTAKLTITLENDVMDGGEVVVTGYQRISKERATGAYSIIKKEQLDKPSTNISQRLIGQTAGVVPTLDADGNAKFEIRGKSSLNTNAQPLIVVDGFPVEDGFSSVNPNDVENITVLKDAAAASIWGARAGNGVIVITTKKAKAGKLSVDVSAFVKFSNKTDLDYLRPYMTSSETIDYELEDFSTDFRGNTSFPIKNNSINNVQGAYSEALTIANEKRLGHITQAEMDRGIAALRNLDNKQQIKDELLSVPVKQQYNINIAGGTEDFSHNLSLMYSDNNTNFKYDKNRDYLINYKTQASPFKWLTINFSGMMQYKTSKSGGTNERTIKGLLPYEMLREPDGSLRNLSDYYQPMFDRLIPGELFPYDDWSYNPIQEAQNTQKRINNFNARIQGGLTVNIIKGLTATSSIQYEIYDQHRDDLYDESTFFVRNTVNEGSSWNQKTNEVKGNIPKGGFRDRERVLINSYNFRNQVNFERTFADKHQISFVAGTEIIDKVVKKETSPRTFGYDDKRMTVGTFPNGVTGLKNMWGGALNLPYVSKFGYDTDRYFSAYGNLAYTFNQKYTVSGSIRTDASNFISDDPKYRYAPFWSVGGGWNVNNEKFMKNVNWVDRLVLRATYGYNGNADRTTAFMPLISMGSSSDIYTGDLQNKIASYGNPTLRWERTGTFNLGVDFSLLKGKLFGSMEFYNKKGSDLIIDQTISSVYGTTKQKLNNGEMVNRGFELSLGSNMNVYQDKIRWTGNLTMAYNKNRIKKLVKSKYNATELTSTSSISYREGYDVNTLWTYQYRGMENRGTAEHPDWKPVVLGENGNTYDMNTYLIGDARNFMGNGGTSVAPLTASFSSSFKIYDFDLSFMLIGKFGHSYRRTGFNYPTLGFEKGIPNKFYREVVGNEFIQPPTNEPNYMFWGVIFIPNMDNMIADASHIRIQEVNLSYNLPKRVTEKIGLHSLRVFGQINNLATIKFNNTGEDPEYLYGTIKPTATYTFGVKFNF